MTGDKQLLAMRRNGRRPKAVWITDSDDVYSRTTARDWHLERSAADGQFYAHLRLDAQDIPDALDLRCITGLACHVATDRGEARFHRIFDAVLRAGAAVVAGVCNDTTRVARHNEETIHG